MGYAAMLLPRSIRARSIAATMRSGAQDLCTRFPAPDGIQADGRARNRCIMGIITRIISARSLTPHILLTCTLICWRVRKAAATAER